MPFVPFKLVEMIGVVVLSVLLVWFCCRLVVVVISAVLDGVPFVAEIAVAPVLLVMLDCGHGVAVGEGLHASPGTATACSLAMQSSVAPVPASTSPPPPTTGGSQRPVFAGDKSPPAVAAVSSLRFPLVTCTPIMAQFCNKNASSKSNQNNPTTNIVVYFRHI